MYRPIITETTTRLAGCSFTDWEKLVPALPEGVTIQDIDTNATAQAVQFATLAAYAAYRGGAGCGDHGHEAAMKAAHKAEKRIRKALGYSYP